MPSTADLLRLHELDADLGSAMGALVDGFKAAIEVTGAALEHLSELPEAPTTTALLVATEEADNALERAWACAVWSLDGLDAGYLATDKRYAAAFRAELANARVHCPSLAVSTIRRAFMVVRRALVLYKQALLKCDLDDRLVYVGSTVVDVQVMTGHLSCRLPAELGKVIPFPVERAKRSRARARG